MGEALRLAAGRGSASVVRELVAVGAPRWLVSCGELWSHFSVSVAAGSVFSEQ